MKDKRRLANLDFFPIRRFVLTAAWKKTIGGNAKPPSAQIDPIWLRTVCKQSTGSLASRSTYDPVVQPIDSSATS
jgi:hypothetical protein